MRFCKLLLPLLVSSLAFAAQPDRITGPIDSSQTVTLAGHVAPQAQPQYDQGPVEASYPLTVTMLLMPTASQDRALQELLSEQQDNRSPSFHKWLSPEKFADRFSLNRGDIGRITSWLTSQGFTIVYVARGRDFITFRGDAAQVQSVFKTQVHLYNVNGEKHFANSTPPVIPAALNGIVGGFNGLHNFFPRPYIKQHANYTDPDFTTHFLAPGDIAEIYDINPLYQATPVIDGTGQKMVIVGQTDIYLDDINDFRSAFFGASATIPTTGSGACTTNSSGVIISPCDTSIFQYVISGTSSDPGLSTDDIPEADLDIEWSGSVARNAQIIFVTSKAGVIDSANWAIDHQLAPVISMSYGLCEAFNTAPVIATQDMEFKKAASEGISFFAATGDTGAASCDDATGNDPATLGLSVGYPASSAYVTAVGGTEFNEGSGTYWGTTNGTNGVSVLPNGPQNGYIPELAWNDSTIEHVLAATGGGPSNCAFGSGTTSTEIGGQLFAIEVCDAPPAGGFPKPSWQVAVTPSDSVRDVPDISFSASNANDPYIVCTPQSELGGASSTSSCSGGINSALEDFGSAFGGTSASTPVMAGITVLLNQYLGSAAAGGLGLVNTQLYALYVSDPAAFHDVVAGVDSQTDNDSTNIVPCVATDPGFEPSALRCPAGGTMGFSAGVGYDLTTGLGSADVNALFVAWAATTGGSFTLSASPTSISAVAGQNSNTTTITVTPANGFIGSVTFSCTGLPAGATCSFNPASSATSTVLTVQTLPNMAAGSPSFTVQGTSGALTSGTLVTLDLTASGESFTITPNPTSITIAPGATTGNSVNLTLASSNGFIVTNGGNMTTALPLTYTCTVTPAGSEATCSVSPAGSTSVINPSVSIQTVAPTAQLRPPLGRSSRIFYAMLLPGLFGIVFASGSRKATARLLSLIVVLGFATLWLGACSGSSSSSMKNPGTPAGTYTVNVSATTGGGNPIAATMSPAITVTVN
jgi:subtilase family serine protease